MKKGLLRKILTMILVVGLSVTAGIAGTLAYLQDEASDVNVMTLGNVLIKQNEHQRVDTAKNGTLTVDDIEDFVQEKPLLPYVDENINHAMGDDYETITFPDGKTYQLFIGDNAIDKLVSVTNTGKSDAYVRTIIALEAPTDNIDLSFNSKDWTMDKTASSHSIEVNGVKYDLFVCVYKDVLKPSETTPYNLLQIALDYKATNEEVSAFGDLYDVLVLSQAIQAEGFESAQVALDEGFGKVDVDNATEWFEQVIEDYENAVPEFDGYEVSNDAELQAAVAVGETKLLLKAGTYTIDGNYTKGKTLTISSNEGAVVSPRNEGEDGCDYGFDSSNVTFNGVTIDTTSNTGNYKGFARLTATFNYCTFVGSYTTHLVQTFNDCSFDTKNGYIWIWGAEEVNFNECEFGGNSKTILAHGWASSKINITDCDFVASEKGYTGAGDNTAAVEIDPAGTNTYTISFNGNNTITESYAGWTRVKDDSTGHTITGLN